MIHAAPKAVARAILFTAVLLVAPGWWRCTEAADDMAPKPGSPPTTAASAAPVPDPLVLTAEEAYHVGLLNAEVQALQERAERLQQEFRRLQIESPEVRREVQAKTVELNALLDALAQRAKVKRDEGWRIDIQRRRWVR